MTRVVVLVAVLLSIGVASTPIIAAPSASPTAPMTIKVTPQSGSGAFRDTTLVYLDGPIDAGAPDRLSTALGRTTGKIAIWLNSPGGNLFAGMQLGRLIRARGASTYIINPRTLLPGECYSACALAFLGGVYRFSDYGARYGVHQAWLPAERATGERDLGPDLSTAIGSYMREMGVDVRLLDLWMKAAPDEMYVLSQTQAKELGVVNDGRTPPEWSIASFPGGTMLEGRQATAAGRDTVFFSCDDKQTIFGSVYEAAGKGAPVAAREGSHVLTLDSEAVPVKARAVSSTDGSVRSTFVVSPDLVRLAMSAKRIGHQMKPSGHSPAVGVSVDIDDHSALMVRTFLGSCLRRQVK